MPFVNVPVTVPTDVPLTPPVSDELLTTGGSHV